MTAPTQAARREARAQLRPLFELDNLGPVLDLPLASDARRPMGDEEE